MAWQIGITPDVFWSLTPYEFVLACKGHMQREEQDIKKLAWHLAPLLTVITHKRISAKELLEPENVIPEFASKEEFKAYMRERKEKRERENEQKAIRERRELRLLEGADRI
jgi:hypothetical protein